MQRIAQGQSVEGLSQNAIERIQAKIQTVEQLSGKPFTQVVQPGTSNYAEVQQGKIHDTLNQHDRNLKDGNENLKQEIRLENQPSLGEMAEVAAKGALIGAGLKITFKLIEKYKQGKNPFKGNFDTADWQELGIAAAQGGATGGISGAALYALTNFADLSAPFAGAVVGAGYAVASLANRYTAGEITLDEFLELGQIACAESAIVGLSTAIGQTLIPVPILGAVIGTIAGRMIVGFGKQHLGKEAQKLEKKLEDYYSRCFAKIDHAYEEVAAKIMLEYSRLGDLTKAAFDSTKNVALRLQASVELAEAHGVPQSKIIRSITDLDAFMLS